MTIWLQAWFVVCSSSLRVNEIVAMYLNWSCSTPVTWYRRATSKKSPLDTIEAFLHAIFKCRLSRNIHAYARKYSPIQWGCYYLHNLATCVEEMLPAHAIKIVIKTSAHLVGHAMLSIICSLLNGLWHAVEHGMPCHKLYSHTCMLKCDYMHPDIGTRKQTNMRSSHNL